MKPQRKPHDAENTILVKVRTQAGERVFHLGLGPAGTISFGATGTDVAMGRGSGVPVVGHLERHEDGVWLIPGYGLELRLNARKVSASTRLREVSIIEFRGERVDVLLAPFSDEHLAFSSNFLPSQPDPNQPTSVVRALENEDSSSSGGGAKAQAPLSIRPPSPEDANGAMTEVMGSLPFLLADEDEVAASPGLIAVPPLPPPPEASPPLPTPSSTSPREERLRFSPLAPEERLLVSSLPDASDAEGPETQAFEFPSEALAIPERQRPREESGRLRRPRSRSETACEPAKSRSGEATSQRSVPVLAEKRTAIFERAKRSPLVAGTVAVVVGFSLTVAVLRMGEKEGSPRRASAGVVPEINAKAKATDPPSVELASNVPQGSEAVAAVAPSTPHLAPGPQQKAPPVRSPAEATDPDLARALGFLALGRNTEALAVYEALARRYPEQEPLSKIRDHLRARLVRGQSEVPTQEAEKTP